VKNGIYGEMFVSAMLACAAVTDDIEAIIYGGLGQIPEKSRLYESVEKIISGYRRGDSLEDCRKYIHSQYDEHTDHGWCHVISNAMVVTAALLYGEGDFGKSICIAVETAFDTDCNGATVGSVLGMRGGIGCIDEFWRKPVNGKIQTSIFGVETVDIAQAVEKTLEHIKA
jgi:ADP-ribosylglycohydrolase